MSDLVYHGRRVPGGTSVTRFRRGTHRPLFYPGADLASETDYDWGSKSPAAFRLAYALLAHAVSNKVLAYSAANWFMLETVAALDGDWVLHRDPIRRWFYRDLHWSCEPLGPDGEEPTDGHVII